MSGRGGSYEELLAEIYYQVGYQATDKDGRPEHPLIEVHNQIAISPENLLLLAFEELLELEEQHERFLTKDWWKEWADILVFLRSFQRRLAPKFSVEETIFSVNGQYTGQFQSMKEQLVNLSSGNIEHNLKFFITEILSMLKHLDQETQVKIYLKPYSFSGLLNSYSIG